MSRIVWVALALTIVMAGVLLWFNRQYVFHTTLYENGDWASDSLFVREAERGTLLHGHYSRWAFYHPGPALFYTLAAGEAFFYHALHLVPTPYNGQLIALCVAMAFFLAASLTIFAGELGEKAGGFLFFLPLAFGFGLCHFGAAAGGRLFLNAWPIYPLIAVFVCFVVAVAATASGDGRMLVAVALAGGWLVHNYAAQPLFVVPLTLLAYGGLLASCRPTLSGPQGFGAFLAWGWRRFPKAHLVSAGVLALFILPLALDALHGSDSNLARLIAHVRASHEPHKSFLRSLYYFVTFGCYDTYQYGRPDFDHYSAAGMLAFVERHWRAYALWLVALLGAPALSGAAAWRLRSPGVSPGWQARGGFVAWFYVASFAAFGLTLVWGMKQEGEMFYFNAYFNYSIYYCIALAFAAALSAACMAWTDAARARWVRPVLAVLFWMGVVGTAVYKRESFRTGDTMATADDHQMARTVERAAATLPPGAACFLDCHPWDAWPVTAAVALEVERLDHPFVVKDDWGILFGERHTAHRENPATSRPLVRWMVAPASQDAGHPDPWPLGHGFALEPQGIPGIDPAAADRIDFSKEGNYPGYEFFGWATSEGPWTWTDQPTGLLVFKPQALPENATGVDLVISAWSFAVPGKSGPQRLEVQFNGTALPTATLPIDSPERQPVRIHVSRELWQDAVARQVARLRCVFPDAKSPASLGMGGDTRLLGGGFSRIAFELTVPGAP